MKIISGIFKFFAFLIMCLVILLLPISLFARNVGEILFSRNVISELIEDNFFDEEVLATLAEDMIVSYSPQSESAEETSAISNMLTSSLENLSHDQWVNIFENIIPAELISSTFNSVFDGFYDWLDSDNSMPEIVIDLRPWKENTTDNAIPVIEMILADFPECSAEQLLSLAGNFVGIGGESSGGASIPLCSPTEPFYSQLINQMSSSIPMMFESFPDELDLSVQFASTENDLAAMKELLVSARFILGYAWVLVFLMYLIALPMAARTFSQLFKWAGWPLILSGGLLFGFMLALKLSSSFLISNFSSAFLTDIPVPAASLLETILVSLLSFFAVPLRNQGLILSIIGGVSLIMGYMIGGIKHSNNHENRILKPALTPDFDSMPGTSSTEEEKAPSIDVETEVEET